MALTYILLFTLAASVGSVAVASLFLVIPGKTRTILVPCFVSYATGTLLGAAFLGLIPQALTRLSVHHVGLAILSGIVVFFVLEKLLLWRHCHDGACERHATSGPLILIGDTLHNFVDGVVLAAAMVSSVPLGIATAIAIIAHEIPQEVGDFAILLESGYRRSLAFLYNTISSLGMLAGALIGYFFLSATTGILPHVMALSAASFIYVAVADLVPTLHRRTALRSGVLQLLLIVGGIATIVLLHQS